MASKTKTEIKKENFSDKELALKHLGDNVGAAKVWTPGDSYEADETLYKISLTGKRESYIVRTNFTASGTFSNDLTSYLDPIKDKINVTLIGVPNGVASLDGSTKVPLTQLYIGTPNGIASLDGAGKIPVAQLPNSVMEYQGVWNAATNTPTLADGIGSAGDVWSVNPGGTQDLGSGNITFAAGNWVVYNGTIWEKSNNSVGLMLPTGTTINGLLWWDNADLQWEEYPLLRIIKNSETQHDIIYGGIGKILEITFRSQTTDATLFAITTNFGATVGSDGLFGFKQSSPSSFFNILKGNNKGRIKIYDQEFGESSYTAPVDDNDIPPKKYVDTTKNVKVITTHSSTENIPVTTDVALCSGTITVTLLVTSQISGKATTIRSDGGTVTVSSESGTISGTTSLTSGQFATYVFNGTNFYQIS